MNVYDRPTTINDACEHPVAEHYHGTNACYHLDACRCEPCRQTEQRYRRLQIARLAGVKPSAMVDAEPVREHVRVLMDGGMGSKRIAEVAGVPRGVMSKLMYGDYATGRPPSKVVRRATAEKLLACPLSVADGALVSAVEGRAVVAELVARGWTRAEIARRLGFQSRSLQIPKRRRMQAGYLRRLRVLLTEDVPVRAHPRWGTPCSLPDRPWRVVPASTAGVPEEASARGRGRIVCEWCDEPLSSHRVGSCRFDRVMSL